MLIKITDLTIDPQNPFAQDCLNRKPFADKLERLISTLQQPFVLSLHSPWGTGKTEFVKMFMQSIMAKDYPCIYFNAWENDFTDKPLTAFLGNFFVNVENIHTNYTGTQGTHASFVKATRSTMKKLAIPALKILTRGALETEELKEILSFSPDSGKTLTEGLAKIAEDQLKEYQKKNESIKNFKATLSELRNTLDQYGAKRPLVFFVDELDRCRPTYALELLENIKHLFQSEGFLFLISIDKDQLLNTIKGVYGQGIDADGYLRRFIDYELNLPKPDMESFCNYLQTKLNLKRVLTSDVPNISTNIIQSLSTSASHFEISLRAFAQIFTEIIVIFSLLDESDHLSASVVVPYLLCLRVNNHHEYRRLADKTIPVESLKSLLPQDSAHPESTSIFERLTDHLMRHLLTDADFGKYVSNHTADPVRLRFLMYIDSSTLVSKSFEMIDIASS